MVTRLGNARQVRHLDFFTELGTNLGMNTMVINPEIAKYRLAVNVWWALQNRKESGYAWVADALTERIGRQVHVSRIQKVLQQASSPDWVFVVNLADVLGTTTEELGKPPSKEAEKSYAERFPRIAASA